MKKLPLAILALAAGAGAAYFLHPRHGEQRRTHAREQAMGWWAGLREAAQQRNQALKDWAGRIGRRAQAPEVHDAEGLEPLSMTPAPLQAEHGRRSRVLPALAVATPVAMAMGAVWLRQRGEDGEWLH